MLRKKNTEIVAIVLVACKSKQNVFTISVVQNLVKSVSKPIFKCAQSTFRLHLITPMYKPYNTADGFERFLRSYHNRGIKLRATTKYYTSPWLSSDPTGIGDATFFFLQSFKKSWDIEGNEFK